MWSKYTIMERIRESDVGMHLKTDTGNTFLNLAITLRLYIKMAQMETILIATIGFL